MKKIVIRYSLLLFAALAVFKVLEYTFFSHRISLDVYLGLTGLGFLIVGAAAVRYFLATGTKRRKRNSRARCENAGASI